MPVIIFFIAIWYLSLFSQSFFQHRYASHGAFKMSKGWERFFYVVAFITQGSSYLSPRSYAIMHRLHHAYTDTENDPHSPSYSKNMFDMMWRTWIFYRDIGNGTKVVEERFLKNLPSWNSFDRFVGSLPIRLIWVALYVWFFAAFATSLWQWLLLPVIILMGPVHGAVINWFAHKFGYENYDMDNTSKNLFKIDILMLGESYHNNHHKFPASPNFGRKWHEIDPLYPVIKVFSWLGIIKISKLATVPGAEEVKQVA
jgi:stearoyl-CoA desaturase (delta-9 desaturase)